MLSPLALVVAPAVALAFDLVAPRHAATVLVPAGEPECVWLAAADLVSDVRKITGRSLTLGRSTGEIAPGGVVLASVNQPASAALLESLAPGFAANLNGRWESYRVETVGSRLIIAGSDERGTMFGLYAFIEKHLGVDPLWFWASRPPPPRATLTWDTVKLSSGEPSFRFRGWFINDEDLLTEWKAGGGARHIDYPYYAQVVPREVIRPIVEALVRSRCNLIIPASFVDLMNPPEAALVEECARRGVFVSQHHVEPLGVSAFAYFNYWKARGRDLKYSYFSHPAEVREIWRAYAAKWAAFPNVIWQLGLRGIADRPMWMADPSTPQSDAGRGRLISEAMAEQLRILDEVAPRRPRFTSTTLWAEGSTLNQQKLLTIPPGTIVVFADNSPGWKWQADFYSTPRDPKNSYGVYYHHALWGSGPHLAQVPSPQKTFECLQLAVQQGAGSYAIFNVSNLREFVLGVAASAAMTWRMDGFDPATWLQEWVDGRFSRHQAGIIGAYRTYFDAWQIHDTQRVPFLMDGQMVAMGNATLNQLARQLAAKAPATGTPQAAVRPSAEAPKSRDAFWTALNDAHPSNPGRATVLERLARQQAGLERAMLAASNVAADLPPAEAGLLRDNLVHQASLAHQLGAWLMQVETAQAALDRGDRTGCGAALTAAEAAFARILVLAETYCQGPWAGWYRGAKKINLAATLKRTRDVLHLCLPPSP
ncbi:MAG: glycosyl hydrolase 115 family protein [Verrucomicrobia bacterium]|nr:glycosyl hydrolase 115 family protein [Verrucomicrobiota bacterium]